MSASYLVDLGETCNLKTSVANAPTISPSSGTVIGEIVDFIDANTYTNVFVTGGANSGPVAIQVQVSDGLTSGSFANPHSGYPSTSLPPGFVSGGIFWVNSGLAASGRGLDSSPVDSAPVWCSGGFQSRAFLANARYGRLIALSGPCTTPIMAGFIKQAKTTGSGAGFVYSPTSGSISV